MSWVDTVLRYNSFFAGLLVMVGVGTNYAFSAYSPSLRDLLGFTQTETNLIPSLGGLGVYTGAVSTGALMDYVGARATSIVAAVALCGGWLLLYFASLKMIVYKPVLVGLYYAIQQFGGIAAFYVAYSNVKNFLLKNRGKANGVLVSCYGLSALVVTQIYQHVFKGQVSDLFFFMAILTLSLCFMALAAIHHVPPKSSLPSTKTSTSLATVDSQDNLQISSDINGEHDPEPKPPTIAPLYGERGYLRLLATVDFWLLAALGFTTAGAGLLFITVVGPTAEAWGVLHLISKETYVSVLSLCNASGRLLYGFMSDVLRKRVNTVAFMIPISVVICIAHAILAAFDTHIALMVGTILTGLSYGGYVATANLVINKYFGDKDFSSNLGFNTLLISVSGLIWSLVSGKLSDHFAQDGKHCHGPLCYRYTYILTCGLAFIGTGISVVLLLRERAARKRIHPDENKPLLA